MISVDRQLPIGAAGWCRAVRISLSPHESGVNLPNVETLVYLGFVETIEEDCQPTAGFCFRTQSPISRMATGQNCLRSDAQSLRLMVR